MHKILRFSFFIAILAVLATGCSKTGDDDIITGAPDVSDFAQPTGSPIVPGSASVITITSSSLGSGTFTIDYNMTGSNTGTGLSATFTMAGNAGTFSTPVLANSGATTLTLNSITNNLGKTSKLTVNNMVSLVDSTGQMTATVNGSNSFATTDVTTSTVTTSGGTTLTVSGSVWSPSFSGISLSVNHYNNATGTFNFSTSTSTGSAHYSANGVPQVAVYGTIKLTAVSPVLKGTFSFTNPDSGKVSGTFTAMKP